jgi:hypothetical protein
VRTFKKATTLCGEDKRSLLDTLRQFATLSAARIESERRALLFEDLTRLFLVIRENPVLGFYMAWHRRGHRRRHASAFDVTAVAAW